MVESQHEMLLKMGINHLRAVGGISMGGFQAFQWITAYPDFVDKAVPIVGSPRPTSYDLMFYDAGLKAVKEAIANQSARADLIKTYADFFWLALNTPSYYVRTVKRGDAIASLNGFEQALLKWDPYDMAAGLSALETQDAFQAFGGDPAMAAAAVKAKVCVIVATQDHCVNPGPAIAFAKTIHAELIQLPDDNGHSSTGSEAVAIGRAVDRLLNGS
jgi:homoserine O-acetyltransferase